ncbi:early transcription factor 82 kDa subunit [BeAn 58058 virus]|uniref:early transcription factor 82 kDa subunit n=1 Tax=BeAn 58058 virus TaxID=67082 RepID=UPI00090CD4BD|nr:early transcription factor 82 kDa subunit [BeAn 58058 virus]APG58317.1 early transcription factor 82 kDa subunit [BeAn 58058 virus]
MKYIVNPQLVLYVGKGQEIKRALYLTPYGILDDKSAIYYFLSSHLKITNPEIHTRHILVTLKINQLKGYLTNLLGIDNDIIIYSHKNNLEYSYADNTIFNPFMHTQKKTLIKADGFLYNIYPDACDFLVIWVADASETLIPEFGSYETLDNNIIKFENRLLEVFNTLDLDMVIESKFNNIFRTNLRYTGLNNIIKKVNESNEYTALLYKSDDFFITMTGNRFILTDEKLNLSVWDTDGKLAFSSDGDTVVINNVKLFTNLLENIDTQMERIKGDITYKIFLSNPITSRIKLDIETSFIFVETATNNILLSSDKKISIILAKNHISIKVKNFIPNIEKYFTFLIIAINSMFNDTQQTSDFTKVETVYWSRICQNTKNKHRKPVIIPSLDDDMKKISDNFYKSQTREVFVNDNGIMFSCIDPLGKYNNIGFLSIFHRLQKMCIPCCFLKDQGHTETFLSCIHKKDISSDIINPYILNFGKVVTKSKISFLPIIFDNFFNDGLKIVFESDNKRLKETSGYHVIKSYDDNDIIRLRTVNDIIAFVNTDKNILISDDIVYFPMKYVNIGKKVYILIQEILHEIVIIKKSLEKDQIHIHPPNYKLLKTIFPLQQTDITIREESGMKLTTNGFFVDGKEFNTELSSKYITFTKNISSYSCSNIISKYFSPLFKYVITESKDRFIKTWVINTMLKLSIDTDCNNTNINNTLNKFYPNNGKTIIN